MAGLIAPKLGLGGRSIGGHGDIQAMLDQALLFMGNGLGVDEA